MMIGNGLRDIQKGGELSSSKMVGPGEIGNQRATGRAHIPDFSRKVN